MKFAQLYNIILIVQGKYVKCIRVYNTLNKFYTIFKQLEFDIRTIMILFYFIFYQTISLRPMRNNI